MQLKNNFQTTKFSPLERKIALGLFLILWVFLFVRAVYVPLLHDEIATFFYYVQSDNYLPPNAHWDANNHVLNSFLSNVSYHLFGSSPLALRLPNVLTYALFFYAVFQLAGRLNKKVLRWGFLLALVASHYLFEYFGESRGYGMSIAFFTMALYHLIKVRETDKFSSILFTTLFLFLATSANLTLIIPSVLIFGFLFLHATLTNFRDQKSRFFMQVGSLVLTGLPFLFLVKLSFMFKERGAFYYGGDSGFYDITVKSLSTVFTDFYNLPIAIGLTLIFLGMIVITLVTLLKKRSWRSLLDTSTIFIGLLVANIAAILFLFYKMEVNYPEDRVAMHLFVLFIASFAFILDQWSTKIIPRMVYSGVLLFYFPVLFLFHAHPQGSVFSTEERTPYTIFNYIQQTQRNFKFPNLVGGYKTQEFCWYYMNNRSGGNEGKIHTNYHIALDADFQIVRNGKIEDSILFDYYRPVLNDPTTNLTLFERKKKLEKQLIYTSDVVPTPGMIDHEYHNILEMEIDSLRNSTLYIGAEMTLDASHKPFISWLAVTVNNAEDQSLYSEYIPLDWIRKDWDGTPNNVLHGTLLHHIPNEAKILKFYIWNIDKTSFSIPDGKCYLYRLERDFPNQY